MSATDPRSRLFPPVFMVGGVLAGIGIQALRPFSVIGRTAGHWIGGGVMAGALALGVWAVLAFRRAGTTPDPHGEVSAFVTGGPFAFSRNPMYVTNVAFQVGAALVLDNGWILMLAPLTWLLLDRIIIRGEESYLEHKYGTAYDAYRARVRRWL